MPKAPGTINFGWGHDQDSFTDGITLAAVFTGLPGPQDKKLRYIYVGHYNLQRIAPLGPDAWRARNEEVCDYYHVSN